MKRQETLVLHIYETVKIQVKKMFANCYNKEIINKENERTDAIEERIHLFWVNCSESYNCTKQELVNLLYTCQNVHVSRSSVLCHTRQGLNKISVGCYFQRKRMMQILLPLNWHLFFSIVFRSILFTLDLIFAQYFLQSNVFIVINSMLSCTII